jgi:hypothetical protein
VVVLAAFVVVLGFAAIGYWLVRYALDRHALQTNDLLVAVENVAESIRTLTFPDPSEPITQLAHAHETLAGQFAASLQARMDQADAKWNDVANRVSVATPKRLRVP